MYSYAIANLLVYGGLLVLIFLILRFFWCWYWKINRRVALLEKMSHTLTAILSELEKQRQTDLRKGR
jgi:hypothetical protein